jgi:hypothetical protein
MSLLPHGPHITSATKTFSAAWDEKKKYLNFFLKKRTKKKIKGKNIRGDQPPHFCYGL